MAESLYPPTSPLHAWSLVAAGHPDALRPPPLAAAGAPPAANGGAGASAGGFLGGLFNRSNSSAAPLGALEGGGGSGGDATGGLSPALQALLRQDWRRVLALVAANRCAGALGAWTPCGLIAVVSQPVEAPAKPS